MYQKFFTPLVFFIGPVPVVIAPKLAVTLDANGKAKGDMTLNLTQTFSASVGAEHGSAGWHNAGSGPDFQMTPGPFDGHADALFKVGPTVRPELLLYGVAGATMPISAYAQLKAQFPGKPLWQFNLCASGKFGATLDLFVTSWTYGATLFEVCHTAAQAPSSPPAIQSVSVVQDHPIFDPAEANDPPRPSTP